MGKLATSIGRGTVRKLRIRIIPFLLLLYIVAFLDRINIAFAALTMNKELAITPGQFGLPTGVFVGYFFFEIPSNLLLHKIGARIWRWPDYQRAGYARRPWPIFNELRD
jgi:ACS family tartrate transporter-like MFS transporter